MKESNNANEKKRIPKADPVGYNLIIKLHEENEQLKKQIAQKHQENEALKAAQQRTGIHILKRRHPEEKNHEPHHEKKRAIGIILSIAIPLLIFLYIVVSNFNPEKDTYILDIGTKGDNDTSKDFYLNAGKDLGEIKSEGNTTYRELQGRAYAVFKPKRETEGRSLNITLKGSNVYILSNNTQFNPGEYQWDMDLNQKNKTKWKTQPENNTINLLEGCGISIDGKTRLYLPSSNDSYESAFTVYVEWTPKKSNESSQQIIGHYNWELYQNGDSVQLLAGRMNNSTGISYSIKNKIDKTFFNEQHYAIAVYNPSENPEEQGYIELFIDGIFIERISIGSSRLWKDYNGKTDLSVGKSMHNSTNYFKGCINKALIIEEPIDLFSQQAFIDANNNGTIIPLIGNGKLDSIKSVILKK